MVGQAKNWGVWEHGNGKDGNNATNGENGQWGLRMATSSKKPLWKTRKTQKDRHYDDVAKEYGEYKPIKLPQSFLRIGNHWVSKIIL